MYQESTATYFKSILLLIIFFVGVSSCNTYKQSFKKQESLISPKYERAHAESKFTTYDASNITIGDLEWKGRYWEKIYEYGKVLNIDTFYHADHYWSSSLHFCECRKNI